MNKSQEKSILGGAILLTASSIIVKILGMLYKVPLSYILTDEGMGYFNAAYTVYTFFYIICTAGVPKAISILVSEAQSRADTGAVREIYRTAICMFLFLGGAATVLFFVLAGPISKGTGAPSSYLAMLGIAPSILFVCASGVIRGYFNGKLNMIPLAVSEVISGSAKLVLGLTLAIISARLGAELYVISFFTILGTTAGSIFGFLYLIIEKKKEKDDDIIRQKNTRKALSIKTARKILRIVFPLTLASAIGAVSNLVDLSLIMPRLISCGYSELQAGIIYGNYTTLAVPMLNLAGTVVAPISAVILPIVSGSGGVYRQECKEKIANASAIITGFSIPIAAVMMICPYEILSILFDDSSAILAAPFLSILAASIPLMSLLTIFNTVLEGAGRVRLSLVTLGCCSVVKLVFSYFLIGNSKIAALGAPISTLLGYSVGLFLAYIVAGKDIRSAMSCFGMVVKYLFFSVISLSPLLILKICKGNIHTTVFIFMGAICATLYIVLLLAFDKKMTKNRLLLSK